MDCLQREPLTGPVAESGSRLPGCCLSAVGPAQRTKLSFYKIVAFK